MSWWLHLDKTAGSRPRCVSFMHGERKAVADRLAKLIDQSEVVITSDACWMPRGLPIQKPDGSWDSVPADEAKLDQPNALLTDVESQELSNWWLAHSDKANTPNWDIASRCEVSGKKGMLLIEAKAHAGELKGEEKGKLLVSNASDNSFANHLKIGLAISDAAARFQRSTGLPCAISRDRCYQMSNRFATASKLTDMGYAVVLVYLGFLNAHEMQSGRVLLVSLEQWTALVKQHSAAIDVERYWNKRWTLNDQPFISLIRAVEWPIDPKGNA